MASKIPLIIFEFCWGFLLGVAVLVQIIFAGKAKKKASAGNNIFVIAAFAVALGWFFVRDHIGTYEGNIISVAVGAILMLAGVAGYLWALFTLRNNWSISAEIKEGHTIVTNGPYRFVRHPMYFFMMLVLIGSGLLISNYMILLFSPVVGIAYYFRAKTEERMLKGEFTGYGEYSKKTKMLIPGIFQKGGSMKGKTFLIAVALISGVAFLFGAIDNMMGMGSSSFGLSILVSWACTIALFIMTIIYFASRKTFKGVIAWIIAIIIIAILSFAGGCGLTYMGLSIGSLRG